MKVYSNVAFKDAAKVVLFANEDDDILYHDSEYKHPVAAAEMEVIYFTGAVIQNLTTGEFHLVSRFAPANSSTPYATVRAVGIDSAMYTAEYSSESDSGVG